jgi:hemerythrin-like domain-containing protein
MYISKRIEDLLPIELLMTEHRLIEHMVELLDKELIRMGELKRVDNQFIDHSIDFFRSYSAMCHEAKEENILFRDLARKHLSSEHEDMMVALIKDHAFARSTVDRLVGVRDNLLGDARLEEIIKILTVLADFYPLHIEKEDKRFYQPIMEYFTKEELDNMVNEFYAHDRELYYRQYRQMVHRLAV